ncbi:endonuclease I family protein [Vulgatibacter sp.]|uniref:endonuclease I family protein n=1 Tax=Vulgatibacter sp. TaxID=1971226 RepID=UPI00356854B9
MRTLPLLLLALLVVACAPGEDPPDAGCAEGCGGGGGGCATPVPPADCPAERVAETIDLTNGCPILVCGACPKVEVPACDDGSLEATSDEATGCATSWRCVRCEEPPVPSCPGGSPVAQVDPATGCTTAWGCEGCPPVDPPGCEAPTEVVDPATGCTTAWRCPADPWAEVEALRGAALVEGLHDRVAGHRALSYDGARDEIFGSLDVVDGQIECIYTGRKTRPDGTRTPGDMNTEHSWPQSEGADTVPARSDLHHLFPTDMDANSRRGSLEFGETDCARSSCSWTGGGSEVGPSLAGGGTIFEVRPAYRGEIARAHFYFSVRYRLSIGQAEEAVLRRWHDEDPPGARERARNDGIELLQQNRNPFVDRPDFVGRIADF